MEAACVRPPQPVQPWTSKVKPMRTRVRAAPESRASKTRIHIMSALSSHIAARKCTVQLRPLVRMRFLYQPIIPPRMVATGFLSRRSESLVLCGRTETASAKTCVKRKAVTR
jgi:hypothetical protein